MINPKELYAALAPLGVKRSQLRALLPDWWEESIVASPDGAWEFMLLVARRLSLDVTALSQGTIKRTGAVTSLAYKHAKSTDVAQITGSSLVASSLAQAIVAAVDQPFRLQERDPYALHEKLRKLGGGIADFDSLLLLCWESGIPVVPLPNLPVGMRKMDGAALMIQERPVIIVSRRNDSKSWLSFILGHELGHIVLGHLKPNSSIIDVALQKESTYAAESLADPQEREADAFSLEVLGGNKADAAQARWREREAPVNLAAAARERADELGIAPGHLILRYAFRTKRWQEASMALRFLSEDFDAQATLVSSLEHHLRPNALADDLKDLVMKITGIGVN